MPVPLQANAPPRFHIANACKFHISGGSRSPPTSCTIAPAIVGASFSLVSRANVRTGTARGGCFTTLVGQSERHSSDRQDDSWPASAAYQYAEICRKPPHQEFLGAGRAG